MIAPNMRVVALVRYLKFTFNLRYLIYALNAKFMNVNKILWNRCHTSRHRWLATFCWRDRPEARARPVFSNAPSSLKHGFRRAIQMTTHQKTPENCCSSGGASPPEPPPKRKLRTATIKKEKQNLPLKLMKCRYLSKLRSISIKK